MNTYDTFASEFREETLEEKAIRMFLALSDREKRSAMRKGFVDVWVGNMAQTNRPLTPAKQHRLQVAERSHSTVAVYRRVWCPAPAKSETIAKASCGEASAEFIYSVQ